MECGAGHCATHAGVAECVCEVGLHAEGLSCVPNAGTGGGSGGGSAQGGGGAQAGGSGGGSQTGACANNPCAATGKSCTDSNGVATCSCPPGTADFGSGCVMLDACSRGPCTEPSRNVCYVVDGGASCLCNPGFALDPGGSCMPINAGACTAAPHALPTDDAFEPDECASTSTLYSAPMSHTLTPSDVDWVHAPAAPRQLLKLEVTGSSVPLAVDVFDADAYTAIGADHTGAMNPSFIVAVPNSLAFARISATVGTDTGPYVLTVRDAGFDDYVNVVAAATVITNTGMSGALQYAGDEDVAKVTAYAGHAYGFTINSLPASMVCDVLDLDGTTVKKTLDNTLIASQSLTARAKVNGNWALKVKARSAATTGTYSLNAYDLGVDDHGDTLADADPATLSATPANGNHERGGDVDVFTFPVVAGRIYRLNCTSNSGSSVYGCMSSMRDASGTVVAQQNSSYSSITTIGAVPTAAETWSVSISSYNYSSSGPYTFTLQDLGPDDFGMSTTSPSMLTVGAAATNGRLELYGDHDVFGFSAVAGKIYRVSCAATPLAQCQATVKDPSGATVGVPGYSPYPSRDVLIKAAVAGTYTADVSANVPLDYALSVTEMPADDFSDLPASAVALTAGVATPGVVSYQGDLDWFSFSTVSSTYRLSCTGDSTACAFNVQDPSGNAIFSDVNNIGFKSTGGVWRFAVTGSGGRGTGSYALTLSDSGPDDHSDVGTGATPLTLGAQVAGNIQYSGDVDVFRVAGIIGHLYQVDCSPTGSAYTCGLTVRDGNGGLVASVGAIGGGSLGFEAASTGSYTIEVRSYAASYLGGYTLVVADRGPDDWPDSSITAAPVVLGTGYNGAIEVPMDHDAVSFSAVANHVHRLTCNASGSNLCQVTLRNALNQVTFSGSPTAGTTTLVFYVPTAETWTADFSGTGSTTGTYQFQIADVGADDFPNTGAGAVAVAAGTLNGSLQYAGDVDVVAFTVVAGRWYNLNPITLPTGFNITVRDGSGTVRGNAAGVSFVAGSSGTYTAAFSAGNSSTGAWSVMLSEGVDDAPNGSAGAPVLSVGVPRSARYEYNGDEDWYAVTLTSGTTYTLSASGLPSPGYIYITVLMADGMSSPTGGSTGLAPKTFTPTTSGTYYLRTQAQNPANIGDYTIRVQ
ncbi:MAG: hypothetical protein IPJ65_42125 [Archangiaceae bacterium]|nr:hypothetical protein [Archangiaceae bacterium]